MADSAVAVTAGSGTSIDTRTEATNGHHRQVIVIGDPATNAGVAPVDATAGLKVDLGADNDITGTVTANLSATDNAVLDAIAADTTTIAGDTTSIDSKIPALGQALAAASVPVVLTAAQITTLTPPAAITGFATSAKQDTIIGHVDGIETSLTSIDGKITAVNTGAVVVSSSALPSGAATAAKQPALGTAGTASADVITVQGIASMTALKVDGSAVTQPVSGTVTANLSATDNAVLDSIDSKLSGTLTVTGGGGGVEYTEGDTDASITGSAIMWEDTGDTLRTVSAAKPLPISDAGGTLTVDGTVAVTNADIATIAGAVSGTEMQVDVLTMPTTTVTATDLDIRPLVNTDVVTAELSAVDNAVLDTIAAKDFATQTTLAAINAKMVTGTDIGDVTINNASGAAAVNIQDGGNTITVDGTVAVTNSDITSIKTAVETIDNAISGSEMQVDVVGALPAGTNAIGKLAANSGVDIGDVTLTAGTAAIGTLLPPDIDVTTHTNYKKFYYTNAGAVTDGIVWSPAAGKRWHILWMVVNVSADATVTFEDDKVGGDEVVMKAEIAGKSGFPVTCPEKYPLASGEDAADLLITTSAGNVYVFGCGYEI